jgi:hypothetical protein
MKYHDFPVTWKLRLDVLKNAKPGDYPISGLMGYQADKLVGGSVGLSERPHGVRFACVLTVGDKAARRAAPVSFGPADSHRQVAEVAAVSADNFDRQPTSRLSK